MFNVESAQRNNMNLIKKAKLMLNKSINIRRKEDGQVVKAILRNLQGKGLSLCWNDTDSNKEVFVSLTSKRYLSFYTLMPTHKDLSR